MKIEIQMDDSEAAMAFELCKLAGVPEDVNGVEEIIRQFLVRRSFSAKTPMGTLQSWFSPLTAVMTGLPPKRAFVFILPRWTMTV